ncbi:MAG: peptide ABC transporter substrate-binding protein [Pseudomonadota bacterium]
MRGVVCGAAALTAVACSGPIERPERTDKTRLVRVNFDEIRALDPHKISVVSDSNVAADQFQGLTDLGPDAKPIPGQAKAWRVSDDGLRWTFELRDGLMWSDGTPITADDFVYSFRRIINPATASPYANLLMLIEGAPEILNGAAAPDTLGVFAEGPRTVVIQLTAPQPVFPEVVAIAALVPVPKHVIDIHGDAWSRPENIVSNGAFTMQSWQRQAQMVLKKNPRFIDADTVALETLIYLPISDEMTAVRRFRAGEVDIVPTFPDQMGPVLKEQLGTQVRVTVNQATYYYVFHTQKPPFDNPAVRRALSMAVDRQPLVDSILRSGYRKALAMVPPDTGFYGAPSQPDWAAWTIEERRTEAATLLARAGITPQTPLDIEIRINTSDTHQRIALAIAQMWQPLGINVSLFNTEAAVHFADLRKGNFKLARAGWVADYNAVDNFLFIFLSDNEGLNYARYNSPRYDALVTQGQAASDTTQRMDFMRQAEAQLLADSPIIPLFYYVSKKLVASDIDGWSDNLRDRHRSRWFRFK